MGWQRQSKEYKIRLRSRPQQRAKREACEMASESGGHRGRRQVVVLDHTGLARTLMPYDRVHVSHRRVRISGAGPGAPGYAVGFVSGLWTQ